MLACIIRELNLFGTLDIHIHLLISICIILLLAAGIIFVKKRKRKAWHQYVSSIKKGEFLWIYIVTIPLFYAGILYSDAESVWDKSFFESIDCAISLLAFKVDIDKIYGLYDDCGIYKALVWICYILIIINACLFLCSLFQKNIFRCITAHKWKKICNKVLICGNNSGNIEIANSANNKNCICVISDEMSSEEENELRLKGVPSFNTRLEWDKKSIPTSAVALLERAINENKKCSPENILCDSGNSYSVIVNTESDEKNLEICRELCTKIRSYANEVKNKNEETAKQIIVNLFCHIKVYVFGDANYETLYFEIVNDSYGVIHFINKQRQVAVDYINKYPLTQFMTDEQIDTDKFLLRDNVDINVLLFGFGDTNQQIFLTSVANNQFIKIDANGNETLKPVKYHIFDIKKAENNKELNHNYYRYRNEFFASNALNKIYADCICADRQDADYACRVSYPYCQNVLGKELSDYLPLPMLPAEEYYHRIDINDSAFYSTVKDILSSGNNKINYIVISCGTDLENIDIAGKIIEKRNDWGINNVYVFVKVKSGKSSSSIFNEANKCFMFGNEKETVYNIKSIERSDIMDMTLERNHIYEADKSQNAIDMMYRWYVERTQIERDSNFYAILSLRSKLHMMGLDYVDTAKDEKDKYKTVEKEEYFCIYARGDLPLEDKERKIKYPDSPKNFCKSGRRTMAVQEHYRWNSYMISKGIIPSTVEQIKNDGNGGKDYIRRRHGNLTTFEGLLKFYEITGYDVIKYDYQILDELYDILPDGKKVVRR